MAAAELVNDICNDIGERLGALPFALVIWVKGRAGAKDGVSFSTHPDNVAEAPEACRTAARWFEEVERPGLELHGLDTPDRVCFYEQDFYVLSNFSAFGIRWRGRLFPTVEHAYHFEKFFGGGPGDKIVPGEANSDPRRGFVADDIRNCLSAHDAFKMAQERKASRRPDWDEVKIGVMALLLHAKADQHEYVRRKLLATGDRELVENSWRDDFWGWGPNRDGQNMLGKLWMALRDELRGAR